MTARARRDVPPRASARPAKVRHLGITVPAPSLVPLSEIRPAPENDEHYRPVDPKDPEIIRLAASIRAHGLREPLVLTRDGFILSGHRRYAAARLAGRRHVPATVADVSRTAEPDRFRVLLREHNRQRVKSLDEQVREAIVDADPHECRAELVAYRRQAAELRLASVSVGAHRPRCAISAAKAPFVAAIVRVVEKLRPFWPVSDRQIHYGLLNDPPLRHASKRRSVYRNDRASYQSLTELVTRLRLDGTVPFEAIGDETRPVSLWKTHREPGAFIADEIGAFLKGYWRNLQQSQPNHLEIVVEKNTVAPIVSPVAAEFCIPMTSGRGYCSLPPRHDMAQRFRQSGKATLVVLLVTDFDPDGEAIAETFARSMRDDFGIAALHPVKVALTQAQTLEHQLPPSMLAKSSSSRARGFVDKFGANVWELEALPPATLQAIVRASIVEVVDLPALEHERQQEQADAVQLHAVRETVRRALAEIPSLQASP